MAPTTTAPSSADTIAATSGPATTSGPMPGMTKNAAPKKRPQMPPQKAPFLAPRAHAVARVVVPDDVFFAVIVGADDRELPHVESAVLQRFDGGIGFAVMGVDGDGGSVRGGILHVRQLF